MTTPLVESYEQTLKSDPGNLVFLKLAKLLIDRGESAHAIEVCQRGLRFHPDSILAHVLCAKAELSLGHPAEALALLRTAARIAPDDPQAFNLGGAILHQAHLHREAIPFLERAVALQPKDAAAQRRLDQARASVAGQSETPPAAPPLPNAAQGEAPNAPSFASASAVAATAKTIGELARKAALPSATPAQPQPLQPAGAIDPFAQIAAQAAGISPDEPELPTMVEVSAYLPAGDPPPAHESAATAVGPQQEQSADGLSFREMTQPESEVPPAVEAPSSPFDQVAASADGFDGADLPTMVDIAAYAGVPEPAEMTATSEFAKAAGAAEEGRPPVAGAEATDAAVPGNGGAPLFDEDQRDLSAIFRSLGSDDGGSGAPPAPDAAPAIACADPAAALAGAAQAPMPRLLTSLLSSPDGMRRTSNEAIRASKGWFVPQDLAAQGQHRPSPAIDSEVVEQPRPALRTGAPLSGSGVDCGTEAKVVLDLAPNGTDSGAAEGPGQMPAGADQGLGETAVNQAGAGEATPDSAKEMAGGGSAPGKEGGRTSAVPTPPPVTLTPPPLPPKTKSPSATPPPLPPAAPKPVPAKHASLLEELPDEAIFSKPPRPAQVPSVVVAAQTAEEIAREYERELRERLLAQPPPSFLRRHWLQFAAAAVFLILGVAGIAIYRSSSDETQGARIGQWRADAGRALPLATPQAYRDAIELADRLLSEDPADAEAKAIRAFASAALFQRFGQNREDRAAAEKHLDVVRGLAPGLALAIEYRLEQGGQTVAKSKALAALAKLDVKALRPGFERAEIHLLLAERLIAQKKLEAASAHLTQSLAEDPSHVETLLASGNNLLRPQIAGQSADPDRAFAMFERAQQISPDHVGAILGLLQAALARRDQTPEEDRGHLDLLKRARALYEAAAASPAPWPAAILPQLDLAEGQLRARLGEEGSAAAILSKGAERYPQLRAEFLTALGRAHMRSGRYDQAVEVLSDLAKRAPRDAQLKALYANALISLGRPQEALKVTERPKGSRDLQILRGIALYELGQLERAKAVLLATAPAGKNLPAQAVVYLALIDAQLDPEGALERSLGILATIGPKSRFWPLAQSAMGRLLLEQGKVVEARAALTAAFTKDRLDFESPCLLGRYEARSGQPELARTQLELALGRNQFHLEARLALVDVLLLLGDLRAAERALAPALEGKSSPAALLSNLRLELLKGDLSAARDALTRARKSFPREPEVLLATVQFFALSGEAGQAQTDLKRLRSASVDTRADLADRLRRQGNLGEARALYEALLKRTPGDPRARIGLAEIALAAADKRARAQAQRELDALLKSLGSNAAAIAPEVRARILSAHSQVLTSAKKKNQARRQAAAALAASTFVPEAHLAKAGVDRLFGESAEAVEALERALRLEPALAEAHLDLGLLLASAHADPARARRLLQTAQRLFSEGPQAAQARQALARLTQGDQAQKNPGAAAKAAGKAKLKGKAGAAPNRSEAAQSARSASPRPQ